MTLPVQTPIARPASNGCRTILILFGLVCACSCTVLSLGVDMLDVGTGNWLAGMATAVLPVPIYLALALWLDRFEPEPGWMLALTFFWGAIVAGLFATFFNTMGGLLVAAAAGETAGTLFSLVISAPLVEETAKGAAILILFFWKRNEFDNVTDGVIYAAMAGLGFAMTENALYYGRQFASGGMADMLSLFVSRGVYAPYLHPVFTAMTGAGLGIAASTSRGWLKWLAPLAGFTLAVSLHAGWNSLAILGGAASGLGVLKYMCVSLPALGFVLIITAISLRGEYRAARQYLRPELENGTLTQVEYDLLTSLPLRSRDSWRAFFHGGFSALRRRNAFHLAAANLALLRDRVSRGILTVEDATSREADLLEMISRLRA